MKVIALTGRAGSGKNTAALGIRLLTGSLDPTWLINSGGRATNYHVDLDDFFNTEWPNESTDMQNQWLEAKFAAPVYHIAAILTGHMDVSQIMNEKFKSTVWDIGDAGYTGRQILQLVGTEMGRNIFNPNIWIKLMDRQLTALQNMGCKGVLITDCRFLNKGEFLQEKWDAFFLSLVGRDAGVPTTHQSEAEIDNLPAHIGINNRGSYKDLMNILSEICKHLNIHNSNYTWK